ncbi:MAG: hypothetical protein LBD24_06605 [Spirochaetaceae bacterium]|jgi:hypothetical protein|nr:hypothetical protein [Spirochaetaceae bacterium]
MDKMIEQAGKITGHMVNRMADAPRSNTVGNEASEAIRELERVPGITPASSRDLKASNNLFSLRDGTVVSRYKNPIGFEHIFLSNERGECIYGGYVGWIHNDGLLDAVDRIRQKYT